METIKEIILMTGLTVLLPSIALLGVLFQTLFQREFMQSISFFSRFLMKILIIGGVISMLEVWGWGLHPSMYIAVLNSLIVIFFIDYKGRGKI